MAGLRDLRWRKSTRSSAGNCVEVAYGPDRVLVRDSANRTGPVLTFEPACFIEFIARIKRCEFDLDCQPTGDVTDPRGSGR